MRAYYKGVAALAARLARQRSVRMKYFEDIRIGETSDLGRHTFTAEDIKSFAARFDPQPLHADDRH